MTLRLHVLGQNMTELVLDKGVLFFSYNTPVAALMDGKMYVTTTRYSNTTSRHITKFVMSGFHDMADVLKIDQSFFDSFIS